MVTITKKEKDIIDKLLEEKKITVKIVTEEHKYYYNRFSLTFERSFFKDLTFVPVVTFEGFIGGCGLLTCRGINAISLKQVDDEEIEKLGIIFRNINYIANRFREFGMNSYTAGSLIYTLGDIYKDARELVAKIGFKEIDCYDNYAHQVGYMQKLYSLKLSKGN